MYAAGDGCKQHSSCPFRRPKAATCRSGYVNERLASCARAEGLCRTLHLSFEGHEDFRDLCQETHPLPKICAKVQPLMEEAILRMVFSAGPDVRGL